MAEKVLVWDDKVLPQGGAGREGVAGATDQPGGGGLHGVREKQEGLGAIKSDILRACVFVREVFL
jgi:hypothetical protein